MKRNKIMDEIRQSITPDIKRDIDKAFRISDRIYAILQQQGKTQRDLAKALGKSESEVSKWLSGSHNFTIQTINRIETVLGVSVVEVTGNQMKDELECAQATMPATRKYTFDTGISKMPAYSLNLQWTRYTDTRIKQHSN